jgi:hypothetical protein
MLTTGMTGNLGQYWQFVIGEAIQQPSSFALSNPTPLFEKE